MSDVESKEPKYPRRSFGFVKNETLASLGASASQAEMQVIMTIVFIMLFLLFVNYHAIYIKTGTPMLGYGLAMTFLQPFYTLWALFVVLSKYIFGK